jgi:hypothetical protein
MAIELTADGVDGLSVYSAHAIYPKYRDGSCEIMFILRHELLDHAIYSTAIFFADGYIMCKNESEIDLSAGARKRLREITHFMAVQISKKLRSI